MARATPQELVGELATEILDSFEKLEVLLALERARAARSLDELVAEARIQRADVQDAVAALETAGVVASRDGRYALRAEGAWTSHVRALAEVYESDRMLVVTTMSKAALERVRAQAARAFADAFVISGNNGKKGEGDPDDG